MKKRIKYIIIFFIGCILISVLSSRITLGINERYSGIIINNLISRSKNLSQFNLKGNVLKVYLLSAGQIYQFDGNLESENLDKNKYYNVKRISDWSGKYIYISEGGDSSILNLNTESLDKMNKAISLGITLLTVIWGSLLYNIYIKRRNNHNISGAMDK